MAENVTQQMENTAPALLEKLVTNPDLCNVVLGLLARCVMLSQERGLPLEGIEIAKAMPSTLANGDLVMRAKVSFYPIATKTPAMWPIQSDFAVYVRFKAHGLGMALQRNPGLAHFFQNMVETIENWARHKNIQFETVRVKQSIISNPGDMLVLKVGKDLDL